MTSTTRSTYISDIPVNIGTIASNSLPINNIAINSIPINTIPNDIVIPTNTIVPTNTLLYNTPSVIRSNNPTVIRSNNPTVIGSNNPTVIGSNNPTVIRSNNPTVISDNSIPTTVIRNNIPTTVIRNNNIPTTVISDNNIPTTVIRNNIPTIISDNNIPTTVIRNNIPVRSDSTQTIFTNNNIQTGVTNNNASINRNNNTQTAVTNNNVLINRNNNTQTAVSIELQKKIFGQRTAVLTPLEINKLFQSPITPEFNLILYIALQRNAISPDIAILQAIAQARTREYLIPIALCLRFGADTNMYVNDPKWGTIHIIGYTYINLGGDRFMENNDMIADENILNIIITMLMAEGSRPSLPMYDRRAGNINSETSNSPSVVEWLNDQGYSNILGRVKIGDSSELQKVFDADSLAIISILLDMPNLMKRNYENRDMILAIRSFSFVVFEKIPTPDTIVGMDYKSLDDAVTYLNSTSFDKLVKRGQLPSYVLVNKILIGMKGYRERGYILPVQELEKMLLSAIAVGTQLDQDQLAIVSVMGRDILTSINKEYEQPYWRKICISPGGDTPEPLRKLAISLNIDPTMSKSTICDNINNLSKADKDALKEAARRRQQLRLAADMGTINEFVGGKIPNLVCRNKALLQNDPLNYNDIDLAYYRDDQGAIWCFGSDSFASVLESGINPYNGTILPDSFKIQLADQINALKRLGINADRGEIGIFNSKIPITFDKAIDSLSEKDVITEKTSEQSVDLFIQLASKNGISSDTIRTLSKDRMTDALQSIGYNINLTPLSTSHALVTTSRIIEYLNRTNPDAINVFFSSLNIPQ